MFGRTSKIKNKSYDEYYGIEKSNNIKKNISSKKKGKKGLCGDKNGMFGKTPYNKGISPSNEIKNKIKKGVVNYWNNLSDNELEKRKNQLRNDWLLKKENYSEIDTVPEKLTESILLKLNINYRKKENIGYYNCDFIIENKIIEVQGDYWHGNPRIYTEFDNIQEKNIMRDNRKLKFLLGKEYNILYLWEYDLKNHIDACENQIKEFING